MQETRKLSTILFGDIVGYTSLMASDEQHALELLNRFKNILEQIVPSHQGEIIQYFGDACLLAFEGTTQGVHCAIALQKAFTENEIPIRIGMHLGEVVFTDNNVFGDGVNIASRIESMGVPGAILISKAIRDQIHNKSEFRLSALGSFDFKNVPEPMKVFALANEGLVVPRQEDMQGKGKKSGPGKSGWQRLVLPILLIGGFFIAGFYFVSKMSPVTPAENEFGIESTIAVFPFDVNGSSDIEYLGEGIVDLISTQLDEIPRLNSIDPNLVFSRLENENNISRKPEKAAELSKSMGATKYILGSIVQIGEDLQFSATKYNAQGTEIIRQSVKANNEAIATTINDLIQKLVADELQEAGYELGNLGALTSNNLESLKLYLEGEQAYRELDYRKAHELFTQATELDSTFALAWMRVTNAETWIGWVSAEAPLQKWGEYRHTMPLKWQLYYDAARLHRKADQRAIAIYKNLIQRYGDTPVFHNGLAEFYFHLNEAYGRSPTEAKPHLLKTIELDPGNQEVLWHLENIAVMENDMEAMQEVLSLQKSSRNGKMLKLIIQDTVTDAELEEVLALYPEESAFFPLLYFASEEKPFHNELIDRIIRLRPSADGERFANVAKFCTTGRESEGFSAWKEMSKIPYEFGSINMGEAFRCLPAHLIAVGDFLPFSEHYESLYLDTKDRDTPWDTYAAIKYALALNKNNEATELKEKLQGLAKTPETNAMVKNFSFAIQAFETKMAGENDMAMAYIDSSYQNPIGHWETQFVGMDKSIMAANIYAERGEFEKAISYFDHSYVITFGGDAMMGYRNYKLSQWYEAIGDTQHALTKCNILLESYKNCDEKYRPWVEETEERRNRLISIMN